MRKVGRTIVGLLVSTGLAVGCSDVTSQYDSGGSQKTQVPAAANLTSGSTQYLGQCASCHAADGSGTALGNSLVACESCQESFEKLVARIHATMPQGSPATCADTDNCARNTAAHILCSFNPDEAEGCGEASTATAIIPATADLTQGAADYALQCAGCHRPDGNAPGSRNLIGCNACQGTFEALESKIELTMPPPFGTSCTGECAENTAAHIFCAFNPGLADGCPAP